MPGGSEVPAAGWRGEKEELNRGRVLHRHTWSYGPLTVSLVALKKGLRFQSFFCFFKLFVVPPGTGHVPDRWCRESGGKG